MKNGIISLRRMEHYIILLNKMTVYADKNGEK